MSQVFGSADGKHRVLSLDGLRGGAIAAVIFEHFITGVFHTGYIGVQVFFVLSGFLITGILVGYRERYSIGAAARIFFWRRTVRLGPTLYLALAILWLGNLATPATVGWTAIYLNNVKTFLDQHWSAGGHLWSLAVEEQFYLLFFPLVVLIRRSMLELALVAIAIASMVFNVALAAKNVELFGVLLPSAAHALAAGGLLSLWRTRKNSLWMWAQSSTLGFLLSAGLVALFAGVPGISGGARLVLLGIPVDFLAICIIARCVAGRPSAFVRLLSMPALRGLGLISYSLYVWHGIVLDAAPATSRLLLLFVSLFVGALSWAIVERPFMALGRHGRAKGSVGAPSSHST
jgi:peptidoglycan/LPS O-acetylase OafA/YrhL